MKGPKTFYYALSFIALYFSPLTLLCASPPDKPEKVYSIIFIQKPDEWYTKQAELWKKEIGKNPANAEAWRNYYAAVRYERFSETIGTPEKKERLKKIIDEMGRAIPDTYEYHYLKFKNEGGMEDITDLQKAYQLKPDEPEIYSDFVGYYELHGDRNSMREFLEKWYHSKHLAPGLLNYNYNVLMSLEKDAILITNGDNDTYPIWMLQQVKGVRPDVTVLNQSLSNYKESYLNRKLKEKGINLDYEQFPKYHTPAFISHLGKYLWDKYPAQPVYYAVTVYNQFIDPIKENLYIVGLAYRYSGERLDNVAYIRKNLEKQFRWDYLKYDWYSEDYLATSLMPRMNINYIVPIIMLAENYHISGDSDAVQKWINVALDLAEQGGIKKDLLEDLKEKGLVGR